VGLVEILVHSCESVLEVLAELIVHSFTAWVSLLLTLAGGSSVKVFSLDAVGSLVSLQMSFLSECLVTESAGKWTDILVHPHVDDEIVGLGEGFAADLTIFKDPVACFAARDCGPVDCLGQGKFR